MNINWQIILEDSTHKDVPEHTIEDADSSVHMLGALTCMSQDLLVDGQLFIDVTKGIVLANGAVVVGSHVSQFTSEQHEQSGYSAVLILAESHISIHTWPELNMVEIDVYLCNVMKDNRSSCRAIFRQLAEKFTPVEIMYSEIPRPRIVYERINTNVMAGAANAQL